jgi:hypothetical protein
VHGAGAVCVCVCAFVIVQAISGVGAHACAQLLGADLTQSNEDNIERVCRLYTIIGSVRTLCSACVSCADWERALDAGCAHCRASVHADA